MGALGGAKAQPLVFRQGGAADRLFRGSFAGVALSGGGRSRKKPEKHRGPCGKVGSCSDHSDLLLPRLTSTRNDVLCA